MGSGSGWWRMGLAALLASGAMAACALLGSDLDRYDTPSSDPALADGASAGDGTASTDAPDKDANEPATDAGAEAASDATIDALPDGGCAVGFARCGAGCVANNCAGCASATFLCKSTRVCVTNCTACVGSPIECVACNLSQNQPIATCESASNGTYCLNANYSNAHNGNAGMHCDCSDGLVANCIAGSQVCRDIGGDDHCITCGEQGQNTNGRTCKTGGTCNTALSPPRCQ